MTLIPEQQINFWMERVETFASDKNERVRQRAIGVAEVLIPAYIKGQEKIQQLIDNYCDKVGILAVLLKKQIIYQECILALTKSTLYPNIDDVVKIFFSKKQHSKR